MERIISAKRNNTRVSLKDLREVLLAIRKKKVDDAEKYLDNVLKHKDFIPYKHYPHGHKHGIQAGYPEKAIKEVKYLLHQLKANVKSLGGNEKDIVIEGFNLGRGTYPRVFNWARLVKSHRGKRSNIEIYTKINIEEKPKEQPKEQPVQQETKV